MQEPEFYRDLIFIGGAKIGQMHQYDDELYWCNDTLHSVVQRFPDRIFYRFSFNAIYRVAIELRSWNRFSQECKLALV